MDRNDIKCQECGRYIFNGLEYWCVPYSGECITATSNTTKKHVFTQGTRREEYNGYQFCPTCMTKHKNKCPVCDKPLTIKRAWKYFIPIIINDKRVIVSFILADEKDSSSETRFNIVIGDVKTEQITNFNDSDIILRNSINKAILATLGDCEWCWDEY